MQETLAKTYVEWRACSNPCVKKASPPSPSLLFQCYLYGLKGKKTLYSPAYSLSISNTLTLLSCLFQNHRLLPTKIHHSFMHPVLFDPNSTDKILFDPNSLPPKSYYIIKKIKKTSVFCIFLTPYLITIARM